MEESDAAQFVQLNVIENFCNPLAEYELRSRLQLCRQRKGKELQTREMQRPARTNTQDFKW